MRSRASLCCHRHSLFQDDPSCEDQRLTTCFLQKPKRPDAGAAVSRDETDLANITDIEFWTHKQNTTTLHIFDDLNRLVVNDHAGLNLFVNKRSCPNDVFKLDFAFRRTAGQEVSRLESYFTDRDTELCR